MLRKLDGLGYVDILSSGIKNLDKYRKVLNDLNVFPVPDGDTGTNMVMTLRYGYEAVKNTSGSLSDISRMFAKSAVFGARGNSGVIVSQFFKGIADSFEGIDEADPQQFSAALRAGCRAAYAAVAAPVEGTMLTVLKDASEAVINSHELNSIEKVVDVYLKEACISLQNTPNLLPILKKANVVDSGASGIVYFFEGVNKHLNGETINIIEETHDSEEFIDLTKFNKDTVFEYGYCNEGLLQLKTDVSEFDLADFTEKLTAIGESVVTTLEGDKVKLHAHTKDLGRLMSFCQSYGEFLTIKIENMTVQNLQQEANKGNTRKLLFSDSRETGSFGTVAVATNAYMQQKFFDMGADVVIFSELAPSSKDFLDAFEKIGAEEIIVFPNCSNSILSAEQAGEMVEGKKIHVVKCNSSAECHAALSIIDFSDDVESVISTVDQSISSAKEITVYRSTMNRTYGHHTILENDLMALCGKDILAVGENIKKVLIKAIEKAMKENEYTFVTVFHGKSISEEQAESLCSAVTDLGYDLEAVAVQTLEEAYELIVTLE